MADISWALSTLEASVEEGPWIFFGSLFGALKLRTYGQSRKGAEMESHFEEGN